MRTDLHLPTPTAEIGIQAREIFSGTEGGQLESSFTSRPPPYSFSCLRIFTFYRQKLASSNNWPVGAMVARSPPIGLPPCYGQAEAVGSSPTSVAPFCSFCAYFTLCGEMASMRVQRIFLHVIVDGRGSWRVGGLASGGFGERALLVLSLFQLEQYNKQDGMVQQAPFCKPNSPRK